jgi:hypothetical protein
MKRLAIAEEFPQPGVVEANLQVEMNAGEPHERAEEKQQAAEEEPRVEERKTRGKNKKR